MSKHSKNLEKVGVMVVDPRGRVGMVAAVLLRTCRIQYGSAGPYATHYKKNLRVATEQEIKDAGLKGVGGVIPE
jgi:hypothetical protein